MKARRCSQSAGQPPPSPAGPALLLAALLAPALAARAGSPDWLQAAARQPLPVYPSDTEAVMLLDEQVTTVSDTGEIKTRYRRAYNILRPEGRNFGTVSVSNASATRPTKLKGWSLPAAGKEYEVKEKDDAETSPFGVALYE